MSNKLPRAGVLPDTDTREVKACALCDSPIPLWPPRRKYCSKECQRKVRYAAMGRGVPPPKVKQKDGPALKQEKPHAWIEARMRWWADYHKRHKTFRIRDGWEGWHSNLLGGE